jgi:hypothetical protein
MMNRASHQTSRNRLLLSGLLSGNPAIDANALRFDYPPPDWPDALYEKSDIEFSLGVRVEQMDRERLADDSISAKELLPA